jgi:hypothetical protein
MTELLDFSVPLQLKANDGLTKKGTDHGASLLFARDMTGNAMR